MQLVKMDVKKKIEEERGMYVFLENVEELTGKNHLAFVGTLQQYMNNPDNERLRKVVLDNASTAMKSLTRLYNNRYLPSDEMLRDLKKMLKFLERYFDNYGYGRKVGKKLRRTYLLLHNYLKRISESRKQTEDKSDEFNPNKIYRQSYYRYLKENVARIKRGLNPNSSEESWGIDTSTELGQLQSLALRDSLKSLKDGLDHSQSRGNLEFHFGNKTFGHLADETMLQAALRLQNRETEKHITIIRQLEGLTTKELSDNWLIKRVRKRIKEKKK